MALTAAQKRIAAKNRAYWANREAEQLRHNLTEETAYTRRLDKIHRDMLDAVQREINAFYGKYAASEGITIADAKKRVSKLDIAAYERKAARYVKEKNFSKRANEEMRIYNLTMKINRLELLKANIGLELLAGTDEIEAYMSEILQGRTMDELRRQAGILGDTVQVNAKTAREIVNASFHNARFSDRIWANFALLKSDLDKLLQSGLIGGKNPRELAKSLRNQLINPKKGARYNTERLMRTELARVQTGAQETAFKAQGFKRYQFIVNGGCCDICKAIAKKNGGIYKVSEMQYGYNAPPVHPHCRCSTAAYDDGAEYEAWLDYLSKGGTTESAVKIRSWQERQKDFLRQTGLKRQSAREQIIKKTQILAERGVKPITIISDASINRVALAIGKVYSKTQYEYIQQQHKELLLYAREKNRCNESAFAFSKDFTRRKEILGTETDISFSDLRLGDSILIMHNHPRNSSYSTTDIIEFFSNDSIKTLTIVKNNGGIEILTKASAYDTLRAKTEFARGLKKQKNKEKVVSGWISKMQQEGAVEWIIEK